MLMRKTISLLALAAFIALPAEAQFREAVQNSRPSSRIYGATGVVGSVMNKLFSPTVFRMSHGLEMTAGSFGGRGYSMGMYTNSMAWQFNNKLAARMDVSVAYSPQNRAATALGLGQERPQVFLRNAEVAWRPSSKFQVHLQVRQNPYGSRMNPYGYYSLYRYGSFMQAGFGGPSPDLFWRDRR